jgi:hypothetical protein
MVYEWLDAVSKNPELADPIDYAMYQTAKGVYTEGKSLVKNVKEKDWDAISYKAGEGCFLLAESGVSSYASKAVFTKFKTPLGGKNALLDEPSINTSNFNFNKTTNPIKSKFFANQKATISRILRDETGAIGIGGNKNVGASEVKLLPEPKISPRRQAALDKLDKAAKGKINPTIDTNTGYEVGTMYVDPNGNAMISPKGGGINPNGTGYRGIDMETLYPNGSVYQRNNPNGHASMPGQNHGHGHLLGTGPGKRGAGPSIDINGNNVPFYSSSAHWPTK